MKDGFILFGDRGLRPQTAVRMSILILSVNATIAPLVMRLGTFMMYNQPVVCCPGIVYPNQLNRVERVRFEGDLQGLGNRHFNRCEGGGAVLQQLWPLEVGSTK